MSGNKKFYQLSQVFYQNEKSLKNLSDKIESSFSLSEYESVLQGARPLVEQFHSCRDFLEQRVFMNQNNKTDVIKALVAVVKKAFMNQPIRLFALASIDALLTDDKSNLKALRLVIEDESEEDNFLGNLMNILHNKDLEENLIYECASRIYSFVITDLDKQVYGQKQRDFLVVLCQLSDSFKNEKLFQPRISELTFAICVANLIKHEHICRDFLGTSGVDIIHEFLVKGSNELQLMYYCILNLWLLSFCEDSIPIFSNPKHGFIRLTIEIIQKISREKLVRVAFSCFKNLVDKSQVCTELMVDLGLLKIVDTLLRGNIKDKEVMTDIQYVGEILERNIKILTSTEKYTKQLYAQNLEWSPVHSEKFWKEHVKRFEDNDFDMIKKLVELLDSDREKNRAIACFDIGEFCRFHPYGRNVIESLGAKDKILKLAKSMDSSIRENALLALQKIMLQNWNIGGK